MYHGDNPIAIASQLHIAEILLKMLTKQPFSQVSIRDLCKEADVSRQTFYSLFETKENVIGFVLENQFPLVLNKLYVDNERLEIYDICQGFGEYISNAKAFLKKVISCGLTHLVTDHFYHSILECERYRVKAGDVDDLDDATMRKYHASFIAGGLTNMLKVYLEDEREMDAKEITKLCYRLLSKKAL